MGESIQAVHSSQLTNDIITQEKSGQVKLWRIADKSHYIPAQSYTCNGGYCKSIVVNRQCLLVPQANSTIDIVDINTMTKVRRLVPPPPKTNTDGGQLGEVMCVQTVELAADKTYILGGYESGDIVLWDYATARACSHIRLRECITSLTFDQVSGRGICGNSSNRLQIFTIDRAVTAITLKCEISITNEGCNIVRLRPDRKVFASGGWDGRLRVFSWKSLRLLAVLNEHQGGKVTDVQFSPSAVRFWDANIMAASGSDGTISLWNLYN